MAAKSARGPTPAALPSPDAGDDPDLRALARAHTEAAIQALVIALDDKRDRVRAAAALLDRGWGRPAPVAAGTGPDTSYIDLLASLGPDDTPQFDQAPDPGAEARPELARLPGPVRPPGAAHDA